MSFEITSSTNQTPGWRGVLFPLVIVGLGLCSVVGQLWQNAREILTYEHVAGKVTSYIAPDRNAEDRNLEDGRIEFDYEAAGVTHHGVYPPKQKRWTGWANFEGMNREWRPRDEIAVYYSPANPAIHKLSLRIEPFPLAMLTFLAPFAYAFVVLPLRSGGQADNAASRDEVNRNNAWNNVQIAYWVLSVVASFGLMVVSSLLDWRVLVAVGLLLPTVVVPGAVWLLGRWISPAGAGATITDAQGIRVRSKQELKRASKRLNRRQRIVAFALASLFWWGILSLILVVELIRPGLEWRRATSEYQTAVGRLTDVREKTRTDSDGRTYYVAIVEYEFNVAGQTYHADRIGFNDHAAGPKSSADAVLATYAAGDTVTVFYDPADPHRAVLDMDFWKHHLFTVFFLMPFVAIGIMLLVFALPTNVYERATSLDAKPNALVIACVCWFIVHIPTTIALAIFGAEQPDHTDLVWTGFTISGGAFVAGYAVGLLQVKRLRDDG